MGPPMRYICRILDRRDCIESSAVVSPAPHTSRKDSDLHRTFFSWQRLHCLSISNATLLRVCDPCADLPRSSWGGFGWPCLRHRVISEA